MTKCGRSVLKTIMMLTALTMATSAVAQPVSPSPITGVQATAASAPLDAARLAAAKVLIDTTLPPDRRDAMLTDMMKSMSANITASLQNSPEIANLFSSDPRVQPIFERFITKVQDESLRRLKTGLPDMVEAMQRAYARRFTAAQMAELSAFFSTPTGRLYTEQGQTIMSDPDVAAWQRKTMGEAFSKIPDEMRALVAEIMALKPPVKSK